MTCKKAVNWQKSSYIDYIFSWQGLVSPSPTV